MWIFLGIKEIQRGFSLRTLSKHALDMDRKENVKKVAIGQFYCKNPLYSFFLILPPLPTNSNIFHHDIVTSVQVGACHPFLNFFESVNFVR